MPYLTADNEIRTLITQLSQAKTLWVDTEIADYTTKNRKLSLILVSADAQDRSGKHTYILDVLDQPELAQEFIRQIMINPNIQKIFHHANYDLPFLGGDAAQNVSCTLKMAAKIPYYILPLPNRRLKTLAEQLSYFSDVDKSEQGGDWGQRPLTAKQLDYAKMDTVYLAQIYCRLQELIQECYPDPAAEDLSQLEERYQEVEPQWKELDSEVEQLKERIKQAMQAQNLAETSAFKLASYLPSPKVDFSQLSKLVQTQNIPLDFPVTLTKEIQQQLGNVIDHPSLPIEKVHSWRLTPKSSRRASKSSQTQEFDPTTEDLSQLDQRYQDIQPHWKLLDSEVNHLKERLKTAMQVQEIPETSYFKLTSSTPTLKTRFAQLTQLIQTLGIKLDFPVTLTKEIQKELGDAFTQLSIPTEPTLSWRLTPKTTAAEEELEF